MLECIMDFFLSLERAGVDQKVCEQRKQRFLSMSMSMSKFIKAHRKQRERNHRNIVCDKPKKQHSFARPRPKQPVQNTLESHQPLTQLLPNTKIPIPPPSPPPQTQCLRTLYPSHHSLTPLLTLLPTLTATRTATRATCTAPPRTSRRRPTSLLSPLNSSRSPSICAERSDSGGQGEWERERAGCCWEELGWMGVGGRKEKEEPVLLVTGVSGVPGMEICLVERAGEGGEGRRGEGGRGIISPFPSSTTWLSWRRMIWGRCGRWGRARAREGGRWDSWG